MKAIKVSEKVKSELDNLALDKETYNLTIQRIIKEYEELKQDEVMYKGIINNVLNKSEVKI